MRYSGQIKLEVCEPMRAATIGIVLSILSLCAACRTAAPPVEAAPAVSDMATSYRLGPSDKLRILTFNEPSLSGEFTVNELGRVSLPLIGETQAGGLTLDQFKAGVTSALANGYLINPRVSVEVLNYRPYYILGEIAKPGEYPFSNGLTITNAVATAGGFTYRANLKRVFIRGQGDVKERQIPLTSTVVVRPGDTIRIAERLF